MPSPGGVSVYRLRVVLEDVEPTVWRRLLVPGNVRLDKLHHMFQAAMGWTNSHLHSFTIGDDLYGMQFDDYPEEELDEKGVTLEQAMGTGERFSYEYDFGDGWGHEVVVEEVVRNPRALKFAVCLEGENACPPEDCGGPYAYAELLEVLADPGHDDHDQLLAWVGGPFDATAFDLVAANVALQQVR